MPSAGSMEYKMSVQNDLMMFELKWARNEPRTWIVSPEQLREFEAIARRLQRQRDEEIAIAALNSSG